MWLTGQKKPSVKVWTKFCSKHILSHKIPSLSWEGELLRIEASDSSTWKRQSQRQLVISQYASLIFLHPKSLNFNQAIAFSSFWVMSLWGQNMVSPLLWPLFPLLNHRCEGRWAGAALSQSTEGRLYGEDHRATRQSLGSQVCGCSTSHTVRAWLLEKAE